MPLPKQTNKCPSLQEIAGISIRQKFLGPETPVSLQGGVVGITIDWNCDLDWHVQYCKPIYEFHGLYEEKNLSPGFNFRCLSGLHQCTLPWCPTTPEKPQKVFYSQNPLRPSKCPQKGSRGSWATLILLGLAKQGAHRKQNLGSLSPLT